MTWLRWPRRHRRDGNEAAVRARLVAERALCEEQRRLTEARKLGAAARANRDGFAEAIRTAFGGQP